MSVVYIRDLVITATHGVHPHEKQQPQRFSVTVELQIDTTHAAISDDLADTLNYSQARKITIEVVQNNSFNLLERLAQTIADRLLAADPRIEKAHVAIEKLDIFDSGVPGIRLEVSR